MILISPYSSFDYLDCGPHRLFQGKENIKGTNLSESAFMAKLSDYIQADIKVVKDDLLGTSSHRIGKFSKL